MLVASARPSYRDNALLLSQGWSTQSRPSRGPKRCSPISRATLTGVAISNRRLLAFDETDGADRQLVMTLGTDEFIRRFLLHALPRGFHPIRHYGLLARPQHTHCGRRSNSRHPSSATPRSSLLPVTPAGMVTQSSDNSHRSHHVPRFPQPVVTAPRSAETIVCGPRVRSSETFVRLAASETLHEGRPAAFGS